MSDPIPDDIDNNNDVNEERREKFRFDLQKCEEEFIKIVPDYVNDITTSECNSASFEFAKIILYEFGPMSRMVSRATRKLWLLKLDNGPAPVHVFILSYQSLDMATRVSPNNILKLTITQASLLALQKIAKGMDAFVAEGTYLLTPYGREIFSRNDIETIATDIYGNNDPASIVSTLNAINQSCEPEGQYLPHSLSYIAVIAEICRTVWVVERDTIIRKTIKQYGKKGKLMNLQKFDQWAKYVKGEICNEHPAEDLAKRFDEVRKYFVGIYAYKEEVAILHNIDETLFT